MSYKSVAINAVKLILEKKVPPAAAWQQAVQHEYPLSKSSQSKSCPRNTFLGLCGEGKILGVRKGRYTGSDLNKEYAIAAVFILNLNQDDLPSVSELWSLVLNFLNADRNKKHNSQMNVVMGLWEGGFIKI